MKPTLLYLLLAIALSSCQTRVETRPLEGGGSVTVTSKGLSDRAATTGLLIGDRLLDRYLGADVEPQPAK